MAYGEQDSSPSLNNAINSSNAFAGIIVPSTDWQLEILHMPLTTSYEDIENLFAKYGSIEKIALFYKTKEKSLNCYVSYEREADSVEALKENGNKVGVKIINVIKFTKQTDKGNKRMRTEDEGGWGSAPEPTNNGWGTTETTSTNSWGTNPTNSGASRGRGRGGRGGGGAGRGCFKCGEEGHMSRQCPKGGGSSRSCFKCGEEGHMSRECPKGGGGRGCFNCGEEGHMSRECSKPRSGRGRGGNGSNGGNRGNSSANTWNSNSTSASTSDTFGGWD